MTLWSLIISDMGPAPSHPGIWGALRLYIGYTAYRACVSYRVAHYLYTTGHPTLALYLSQRALARTGAEIHPGAHIGPGIRMIHPVGVVIGEGAIIGANITLLSGVVIGERGGEHGRNGFPRIGENVRLYSGARVLGPVTLGDGAVVGANSVVVRDVSPHTTVVGAPAKSIQHR